MREIDEEIRREKVARDKEREYEKKEKKYVSIIYVLVHLLVYL